MVLSHLELRNIRILEHVALEPAPGLNVFTGANGSGKTSLLEAVYILGRGRSFRSRQIKSVIRKGCPTLTVVGRLQGPAAADTVLGVERGREHYQLRINGEEGRRLSELARELPLQVFTPESHYEFMHGGKARRAALDWGLFHVEQGFHEAWLAYRRLLRQRNALLKRRDLNLSELTAWDMEMAEHGETLTRYRRDYVEKWNRSLQGFADLIRNTETLHVELRRGWPEGEDLLEVLTRDRSRDWETGITHSGPHRSDIHVRLDGGLFAERASQGQQKLVVVALKLAQLEIYRKQTGGLPVVLLDDLPAELDPDHRERLLDRLARTPAQLFTTTTEPGLIHAHRWPGSRVFHVEQGRVRPA